MNGVMNDARDSILLRMELRKVHGIPYRKEWSYERCKGFHTVRNGVMNDLEALQATLLYNDIQKLLNNQIFNSRVCGFPDKYVGKGEQFGTLVKGGQRNSRKLVL